MTSVTALEATGTETARLMPLLMTVSEAAEALRLSESELRRAIARGDCGSVKIGRLRRLSRAQLAAYVERLEMEANARGEGGAA